MDEKVMSDEGQRILGRDAQRNNILAARVVAETVKTTLGPKGMDKMLVDGMGDVVITNDGATILKEIDIEHPAAKMVVEVAKTQDDECGDGTTSAVVLAGELLKKAEDLIEHNVHPTVIAKGYKLASIEAIKILNKLGIKTDLTDTNTLKNVAMTAMTGKSIGTERDYLADITVKAIKAVAEKKGSKYIVDIDNIKIEKKTGGNVRDSELIQGIILDKEKVHPRMPSSVKNAKIALIDSALEIKKTEVDAKIQITDPTQLQAFLDEEEKTLKKKVELIKKSGANVVFCQKGVDDLVQHYLAKENIFTIRRIKKSDMEKLAMATGGHVVTNLDDLNKNDLGFAGMVEEKKIADSDMTFVTGCKDAKSVSMLIRGATTHIIDESDRALHDALKVVAVAVEDGMVIPGGGSAEIELSMGLTKFGTKIGGREQLAIEAYAKATEIIPWTLAENAGLDSIDILIKLRSEHEGKKLKTAGINLDTGKVVDMKRLNIIEPLRVKTQAIESATDVANMILRIDDVIAGKKSAGPPPGAGGGMPGMGGMGGMDF